MRRSGSRLGFRLLGAGLLVPALAGCEWFSTMADGPGISPHEREPLLAPAHAVPLDGLPEFDITNVDQVVVNLATGGPTAAMDSASVARGAATYADFCNVCHGPGGGGTGPIAQVFPAIPAINTPRVAGYSDGYIFALVSKGRGLMPDYGRIPPALRWNVVAYVRTLPGGTGGAAAPGGTAP